MELLAVLQTETQCIQQKSTEVKFLTEKERNITRTSFGTNRPLTAVLKRLLVLDRPLEEIESVKV